MKARHIRRRLAFAVAMKSWWSKSYPETATPGAFGSIRARRTGYHSRSPLVRLSTGRLIRFVHVAHYSMRSPV